MFTTIVFLQSPVVTNTTLPSKHFLGNSSWCHSLSFILIIHELVQYTFIILNISEIQTHSYSILLDNLILIWFNHFIVCLPLLGLSVCVCECIITMYSICMLRHNRQCLWQNVEPFPKSNGQILFFLHKLIRNTLVLENFRQHPFVEPKLIKFNNHREARLFCTSWNAIQDTTLLTFMMVQRSPCVHNRNELKMNKLLCALCYVKIGFMMRFPAILLYNVRCMVSHNVHCHSKMSFAFTFYNMQNGIVLSHSYRRKIQVW